MDNYNAFVFLSHNIYQRAWKKWREHLATRNITLMSQDDLASHTNTKVIPHKQAYLYFPAGPTNRKLLKTVKWKKLHVYLSFRTGFWMPNQIVEVCSRDVMYSIIGPLGETIHIFVLNKKKIIYIIDNFYWQCERLIILWWQGMKA